MPLGNNKPILLVEDNPDHAELIRDALEEAGIRNRIIVAERGNIALDFIYNQGRFSDRKRFPTPNLIILDIQMPDMNGFDVLRIIKKDQVYKAIPIVILTTSNSIFDVNRSYELGANSYVTKPVDYDQFIQRIKEVGNYWIYINE